MGATEIEVTILKKKSQKKKEIEK